MSRVGKQPVQLPAGVSAKVEHGAVLISGPKGKLSVVVRPGTRVEIKDGALVVEKVGRSKQAQANFGSVRAHLNNVVKGVTTGWSKKLELNGVGFAAKLNGSVLNLSVGFSHDVNMPVPSAIVAKVSKNLVELESVDKEIVSNFAARIRQVQPPEPYLGKGIKYSDETIRRKAGKTGKK
jgi:large subunit ribosomal protein L6